MAIKVFRAPQSMVKKRLVGTIETERQIPKLGSVATLLSSSLARATPVWKNRGLVTALHTTSSDGMQLADMVGRAVVAQLTQV